MINEGMHQHAIGVLHLIVPNIKPEHVTGYRYKWAISTDRDAEEEE